MSKRIRAAKEKVIDEARVIHRNGWGNGTTFGLGEAFRELNEAEQEKCEFKCVCGASGCDCPCLKTGGVAE